MVLPVTNPYFKCVALRNVTATGGAGINSATDLGLPATFPCALFSSWVTVSGGTGSSDPLVGFEEGAGGAGQVPFILELNSGLIHIALNRGIGLAIGHGDVSVSLPFNAIVHVLVSVDTPSHRVQVYIDDAPFTLAMTWFNTNQMENVGGHWQYAIFGGGGQQICAGDTWFSNQSTFTDLTVTANRRKFINADLTPVDLGSTGQNPFGTTPPVFLHTGVSGTLDDFLVNHGTGGSWSHSGTEAFAFCVPPTPPPPVETLKLALDDVVCVTIPALQKNLISLEWSDDRGRSFGNPVTQYIGDAGEYRTSLNWQRLGMARDRVWRLSWSVAAPTALQGAWVDVTPAQS